MPAVSAAQQRYFGMVRALQKGQLKDPPENIRRTAASISKEDARDFARTRHEGLPERKEASDQELEAFVARTFQKIAFASGMAPGELDFLARLQQTNPERFAQVIKGYGGYEQKIMQELQQHAAQQAAAGVTGQTAQQAATQAVQQAGRPIVPPAAGAAPGVTPGPLAVRPGMAPAAVTNSATNSATNAASQAAPQMVHPRPIPSGGGATGAATNTATNTATSTASRAAAAARSALSPVNLAKGLGAGAVGAVVDHATGDAGDLGNLVGAENDWNGSYFGQVYNELKPMGVYAGSGGAFGGPAGALAGAAGAGLGTIYRTGKSVFWDVPQAQAAAHEAENAYQQRMADPSMQAATQTRQQRMDAYSKAREAGVDPSQFFGAGVKWDEGKARMDAAIAARQAPAPAPAAAPAPAPTPAPAPRPAVPSPVPTPAPPRPVARPAAAPLPSTGRIFDEYGDRTADFMDGGVYSSYNRADGTHNTRPVTAASQRANAAAAAPRPAAQASAPAPAPRPAAPAGPAYRIVPMNPLVSPNAVPRQMGGTMPAPAGQTAPPMPRPMAAPRLPAPNPAASRPPGVLGAPKLQTSSLQTSKLQPAMPKRAGWLLGLKC